MLDFETIGASSQGYIAVSEFEKHLSFVPKRLFWTYFTPHDIVRGGHAHHETEMVLVAVNGKIELKTESINGEKECFVLDNPAKGVFIPKMCWHTMQYSHNAVQLVIASTIFNEEDYIRSYELFQKMQT